VNTIREQNPTSLAVAIFIPQQLKLKLELVFASGEKHSPSKPENPVVHIPKLGIYLILKHARRWKTQV